MNSNVIVRCKLYIGYTCRHLHHRVEEHRYSVNGKHFSEKHNLKRLNLNTNFKSSRNAEGSFSV